MGLGFANSEDGRTFALPSETVRRTAEKGKLLRRKKYSKKVLQSKKNLLPLHSQRRETHRNEVCGDKKRGVTETEKLEVTQAHYGGRKFINLLGIKMEALALLVFRD